MSLKAIKEALRSYEKHVAQGSYGAALLGAAKEEIDALEKAAKTLCDAKPWAPVTVSTERWTQMRETIESIAKDAP